MLLRIKSLINSDNNVAYIMAAIFFISILTRFLLLDIRAIHHDESLHGYYSWAFARGNGFVHNPLMDSYDLLFALSLFVICLSLGIIYSV